MQLRISFLFCLMLWLSSCAETSIDRVLEKYNQGSVPYIRVQELAGENNGLLLDTREKEEYEVSHIPGAMWVGYQDFEPEELKSVIPNQNTSVVVYCSVGVRSEDIGEKLIKAGYTDVKNLYGGIFEWKNKGYPVIGPDGKPTEYVHAYSKYWGKLLTEAKKVY